MFKTAVSAVKIMPTIFWDVKGVEYSKIMPTGKTINTLHIVEQYGSRKLDFEVCIITLHHYALFSLFFFRPPYDPDLAVGFSSLSKTEEIS